MASVHPIPYATRFVPSRRLSVIDKVRLDPTGPLLRKTSLRSPAPFVSSMVSAYLQLYLTLNGLSSPNHLTGAVSRLSGH